MLSKSALTTATIPNDTAGWLLWQQPGRRLPARLRLLVYFGIASLALTGCAGPVEKLETYRLVDDPPEAIWQPAEFSADAEAFSWTFDSTEDLEPWVLVGIDWHEVLDNSLTLVWSSNTPSLTRGVELDASDLDRIELTMSADTKRPYARRVYWRRRGEKFKKDQWVLARYFDEPVTRAKRFLFELDEHPEWRGEIVALRFQMASFDLNKARINRIRGFKQRVDLDLLGDALERPWIVELDNQLRTARLASPSATITWDVEIPGGAALWFGYGLWPHQVPEPAAPVEFRVTVESDGNERELFNRTLQPKKGSGARWFDGRGDLADFAGRRVELRFETRSTATLEELQALPVWSAPEVSTTKAEAPNVILISIDTLRADRMSLYGRDLDTTPNIDRWARSRGAVFEQTVAPAPWTLPSHVSMLTGVGTPTHGINHEFAMPERMTTLAEVLRAAGYATAAFTGGGFLHPSYGLAQGFDAWSHERRNVIELDHGIAGTLDFIRRNSDRPYLAFLHTYEVHNPYRCREPHFSRLFPDADEGSEWVIDISPITLGNDNFFDRVWRPFRLFQSDPSKGRIRVTRENAARCYDTGIAYTDTRLAELLAAVEQSERNTIVVMTSDHGEHLGENGLYSHYSLYDGNLMVPLVISYPGVVQSGQRVSEQVSLIDIVPTILDLAGQPIPDGVEGRSLVGLLRGEDTGDPPVAWSCNPARAQGISMRIDGRQKYIYNNSAMPETMTNEELYDLRQDPGEETNLAAGSVESEALREQALGRVREIPGLRMELWNHTGDPVCFALSGASRRQIKGVEAVRDTVRWVQGKPVVEVAPESRIELSFELWDPSPLEISAACAHDESTERALLSPLPGDGPWFYDLSDGRWSLAGAEGSLAAVGIELKWVGSPPLMDDHSPDEVDAELAEQLRVLGYIE